ncbi:MAG: RDD family protein [Verrucomicrobiaceae bacterium]|nr:MAG: RDD family protein [Verrucomicrobiaceae bacterium]
MLETAGVDQWYYNEAGQQRGPVPETELKNLLATNRINLATLVWREGMPQWAAAGSVLAADVSPYASPASEAPPEIDWSGYQPSGKQVRPWVRYWARTSDFLFFSLIIGLFLGVVAPDAVVGIPDTVFGLILLVIFNFVEPLFFVIFGTTPFKALLNVRVRNNDGSRLTYARALNRVFKVWFRGSGLGIPLVTLITHIHAYTDLNQKGITSWA